MDFYKIKYVSPPPVTVPSDTYVCSSFLSCSSYVVCSLYLESPWQIFIIAKTVIKNY